MKALITALALSAVACLAHANDGEKVYKSTCAMCHDQALMGAPKFGDKAAWAPRIKQGHDVLVNVVLKGKPNTPMIAKGGNAKLTDDEAKAALDYMLAAVK